MVAYFLASYDIDAPKGYETYVPGVIPLLQKHSAEVLVADYDSHPLEGQPCKVNIVLRFESEEALMNWYNDPAYEPVKQIRFASTKNGTACLTKQFVPPQP